VRVEFFERLQIKPPPTKLALISYEEITLEKTDYHGCSMLVENMKYMKFQYKNLQFQIFAKKKLE
jgi:hypothetical protein